QPGRANRARGAGADEARRRAVAGGVALSEEALRRSGRRGAQASVGKAERRRERRGHRDVDVRLGLLLRLGHQAWMERAVRMALRVEAGKLSEVDEARARDGH